MHLRKLQAVLGLGGPCQSSSQGRRADRADGVVHLHPRSGLVSPDGSSIAPLSVPALVHQEGRTLVRRHVDDPETGQLRGENPTTVSKTEWRSVDPAPDHFMPYEVPSPPIPVHQPRRIDTGELQDAAVMLSRSSVRGSTSEVTSTFDMAPIPESFTQSAS